MPYTNHQNFFELCAHNVNTTQTLYTNTYLAYLKIMNDKRNNEALSICINNAFHTIYGFSDNFYSMSYSVAHKLFRKAYSICNTYLRNEIKKIYLFGTHYIIDKSCESPIGIVEVSYKGYLYSFLVDYTLENNVVILLNFYAPYERANEDLLFTSINNKPFITTQPQIHYQLYNGCYILNTYNAFCSYANHLNIGLSLSFNKTLFSNFIKENNVYIQPATHILPCYTSNTYFKFTKHGNIIIVFDYISSPYAIPVTSNFDYEDDDSANDLVFSMLRDSYAFSDEGLFPL